MPQAAIAPSPVDPMGAVPDAGGTRFRTWSVFATRVYVAGDFTDPPGDPGKLPMAPVPGAPGHWSVYVPGVRPGARYRFVIETPFSPAPLWKIDPYARAATSSRPGGEAIVKDPGDFDWQGDAFRAADWNELVIYELHVGTFYDRPGDAVGDFSRVIDKLGHLQRLGVNAIEVLPDSEFMNEVSMGYNPALLFAVEEAYSREKVFQELVRECHRRGIAVIADVVYNHFGPDDLDPCLRRFDGWFEDGKDGIYFYNDWRSETGFGPRPDYGRADVFQFIRRNALMWLTDYRCDGLRWDSTVNIRNAWGKNDQPAGNIPEGWELMRLINDEIQARFPGRLMIAEDLQGNEWVTRNARDWGAGFGSQWDNAFAHDLYAAILPADDAGRDVGRIKSALERRFNGDAFRRVVYSESHDEVKDGTGRVPEKIHWGHADSWESKKRSTLAAAIALTAPGIPMLFMGQEFLQYGSWSPNLDGALDWSLPDRFPGIFALYQRLIALRRNLDHNTRGLTGQHLNVFHVNDGAKVIAYHRYMDGGPGDDVVVVANFANRAYDGYNVGLPRGGTWYLRFNSDWSGYDPEFSNKGYDTTADPGANQGMPFNGNVALGPYSAIILSQ